MPLYVFKNDIQLYNNKFAFFPVRIFPTSTSISCVMVWFRRVLRIPLHVVIGDLRGGPSDETGINEALGHIRCGTVAQ
jgi:hypothetical protein